MFKNGLYLFPVCTESWVGGAKGGEGFSNKSGGEGAVVMGAIHLLRGTKLKILVGQQGSTKGDGHPGSGGGGTFVVWSTNDSVIAVAGGGGWRL